MVNSLWKTSPSSPPCEGGDEGEVVSSNENTQIFTHFISNNKTVKENGVSGKQAELNYALDSVI